MSRDPLITLLTVIVSASLAVAEGFGKEPTPEDLAECLREAGAVDVRLTTNGLFTLFRQGQVSIEAESLPVLVADEPYSLSHHHIPPVPTDHPEFGNVRRVIDAANDAMAKDRLWNSPAWKASRHQIARDFSTRSDYVFAHEVPVTVPEKGKPVDPSKAEIAGTIGITTAIGLSEDVPMERMRDETDGHGWSIPREDAQDVVIEARVYSMADGVPATAVFSELFSPLSNIILGKIKGRPDLWKQKIIYTYGTEQSVRHYRMSWGFEELTEKDGYKPIRYLGQTWHAMRISPEDWLGNQNRMRQDHVVRTPKGRMWLNTPEFGRLVVDGRIGVGFSGSGKLLEAHLKERAQVKPGVWVPKGGSIIWNEGETLQYGDGSGSPTLGVSNEWFQYSAVEGKTPGSDAEIAPGIWAKAGTSVEMWKDGRVRSCTLARPTTIPPFGIQAKGGTRYYFDDKNDLIVVKTAKGQMLFPGIHISGEESVSIRTTPSGTYMTLPLGKATRLSDGRTLRPGTGRYPVFIQIFVPTGARSPSRVDEIR